MGEQKGREQEKLEACTFLQLCEQLDLALFSLLNVQVQSRGVLDSGTMQKTPKPDSSLLHGVHKYCLPSALGLSFDQHCRQHLPTHPTFCADQAEVDKLGKLWML